MISLIPAISLGNQVVGHLGSAEEQAGHAAPLAVIAGP
jgi:hypothetical protein